MTYTLLKAVHIGCVIVSMSLFVSRYMLLHFRPAAPLHRSLNILPHVVDSVLLAAAVGMLFNLGQWPVDASWLVAKMLGLLCYIGFGIRCLRATPGSRQQSVYFGLAIAAFCYIVLVALSKTAMPLDFAFRGIV